MPFAHWPRCRTRRPHSANRAVPDADTAPEARTGDSANDRAFRRRVHLRGNRWTIGREHVIDLQALRARRQRGEGQQQGADDEVTQQIHAASRS
jgi:hypothetical protein